MTLQAVIFDMDGTMVDSMPIHHVAWMKFLDTHNIKMTDAELTSINHGTLYDIMPKIFGKELPREEIYALGMEKEKIYREMYAPHIAMLPGLEDWMIQLRGAGIKLGLATAADFTNTDFTIDTLGIRHYFDTLVTSDLVPEGKPSPAVYLYAASSLECNPSECIVFEDSPTGIAAGKAAGMRVAAITTMFNDDYWQGKTDLVINDYRTLSLSDVNALF